MFTPPASPVPPRVLRHESPLSDADEESSQYLTVPGHSMMKSLATDSLSSNEQIASTGSHDQQRYSAPVNEKHRFARRAKWTILLVPAVLMLITATTRYISHPALLDALSSDWGTDAGDSPSGLLDMHLHKRHARPEPVPQNAASGTIVSASAPSGSSLVTASIASVSATPSDSVQSQTIPTVPSTPPPLPTPFPQPLDVTLSQNFSTAGCQNFFTNMTLSASFRTCRPFSLLLQTSNQFLQQAQSNITQLNNIVWGTCNPTTDIGQCDANMAWFADALKDSCSKELSLGNAVVKQTLNGLHAFTLMRNAACIVDPTTNAYCFVEAIHNAADLYFYNLPFGLALPNKTVPSCSACTKSVMNLFSQNKNLSTLAEVYDSAAKRADDTCGTGYVQLSTVNSAASQPVALFTSWIFLAVMTFWTLW